MVKLLAWIVSRWIDASVTGQSRQGQVSDEGSQAQFVSCQDFNSLQTNQLTGGSGFLPKDAQHQFSKMLRQK